MQAVEKSPPRKFEDLYPEVAPALYAWASLRVRAPLRARLDPEDLLQEVCFRAWKGFSQFDPGSAPFRAWLFGIANRVLQEALRSLARNPRSTTPTAISAQMRDMPAETTTISRRVARDEAIQRFLERVETLDDSDRKLIILRGLEGLSHSAVANVLALSPEAAAKRWQRLRDSLAEDSTARALFEH